MKTVKLKKRTKVFLIIIAVLILGFGAYLALWFVHYNTLILPMTKNENLIYEETKDNEGLLHKEYTYSDESSVLYSVYCPNFLKFHGNLSIATPVSYDDNWKCLTDYSYDFMYKPNLFRENTYWFTVYDYTECEDINDSETLYSIYTDSQLNFIGGDKEIYDEHYDELKNLYDSAKEFFGEDVFTD